MLILIKLSESLEVRAKSSQTEWWTAGMLQYTGEDKSGKKSKQFKRLY